MSQPMANMNKSAGQWTSFSCKTEPDTLLILLEMSRPAPISCYDSTTPTISTFADCLSRTNNDRTKRTFKNSILFLGSADCGKSYIARSIADITFAQSLVTATDRKTSFCSSPPLAADAPSSRNSRAATTAKICERQLWQDNSPWTTKTCGRQTWKDNSPWPTERASQPSKWDVHPSSSPLTRSKPSNAPVSRST